VADRGHQGKDYRACRSYALERYDNCLRCGRPGDKLLAGRHAWGPTLDLIRPWAKGGQMTIENSALSHNRCNAGYRDGRKLRATTTRRGRYSASGTC
jgi:hypothetical protein